MDDADVTALSQVIDLNALKAYRIAVGRATREVVNRLEPGDAQCKVEPGRLDRLLLDGSVSAEATGLIDYWGKLTFAGLLLMPPTRHCLVHLNEAMKIKARCR
jgi:hypothetical protein